MGEYTARRFVGLGSMERISLRDKKFSDGNGDVLNVVIVNAATISRSYYKDEYNPDKTVLPTCWSSDTQIPSNDVPEENRQAPRCMDCVHNIRGSGYGSSRACRFSQRLAIVKEEDLNYVFQLILPATSIFGEARDGNMPMQAYARFLRDHDTPAIAVVTEMYFDSNSTTPRLFFKPNRPLEDEELNVVSGMIEHSDTIEAITIGYAPYEGAQTSPFESTDGFIFSN